MASVLLIQYVLLRRLAPHVGSLGLCLVQLSGAGSHEETTLNSRGDTMALYQPSGKDDIIKVKI